MDPELVVKFKGDLTEWSAAVAKAKADLSSLSVGMNGTISVQNRFGKSTTESAQSTNQLIASLNSLGRKMQESATQTAANTNALKSNSEALKSSKTNTEQASGGLLSMAKGYLSLSAAMAAGRVFLDSTKEVQKFENQLKVASGTQEQYGKNTQFLEGLAARYNKNVLDLGANFAQLTIATKGTNLEGEKTERLFAAVTATSAALQMSVDDTNGTFRAFIQMVSKGNVQAEELRGQLGERLYGAFNLAAKSMGVTTAELNKMLEKGEVLAEDLLPKLTVELENTFGADAEENSRNLGSSIEYVTGQMTLLIAEMGKSSGFTDVVAGWTSRFGEFLNNLRLVNKEYGFLTAFVGGVAAIDGSSGLERRADEARGKLPKQETPAYTKYPLPGRANVVSSLLGGSSEIGSFPTESTAVLGNSSADEKIKKAAEKAAKAAKAALDKWVSEKLAEFKDETTLALLDSESAINVKYRKQNGTLGAIGQAKPTGTSLNYDSGSDKFNKEFTNPVTGDGVTANRFKNLGDSISTTKGLFTMDEKTLDGGITDKLESLRQKLIDNYGSLKEATNAGFGDFVNSTKQGGQSFSDAVTNLKVYNKIQDLSDKLESSFGSLQGAADSGMAGLVEKIKNGTITYKEAIEAMKKIDGIKQLGENISSALKQAAADTSIAFGEMIGSALAGGEGFANAGQAFGTLLAKLMTDIGKALITYATLIIATEYAISNPYVALVAGIAAVAAGAYLKATMSQSDSTAKGHYTGGIVDGRHGIDNIPIRVSAGEMVLNKNQQSRMFGVLNGAFSGRSLASSYNQSASNGGSNTSGHLSTSIRGSDLAVIVKLGDKKNAKFS